MKRISRLLLFSVLLSPACTPVADRVFTNAKVYSINLDGQVTHAEDKQHPCNRQPLI